MYRPILVIYLALLLDRWLPWQHHLFWRNFSALRVPMGTNRTICSYGDSARSIPSSWISKVCVIWWTPGRAGLSGNEGPDEDVQEADLLRDLTSRQVLDRNVCSSLLRAVLYVWKTNYHIRRTTNCQLWSRQCRCCVRPWPPSATSL
jgi:hypothetical protein